jgi:hypothetical protein
VADLYSFALTSVSDVKETLGISASNTAQDNLIKRKINQATDIIEGYCLLPYNHHFARATYANEVFDASQSNFLTLNMAPVTAVSSFQYRNGVDNTDSWTSFDAQDYFMDTDTGSLLLNFNAWGGWSSYRVSYTAGFDPIPQDLAEACATLAAQMVTNATTGNTVASIREGQREVKYQTGDTEKTLIEQLGLDEALRRYVRVSLGAA